MNTTFLVETPFFQSLKAELGISAERLLEITSEQVTEDAHCDNSLCRLQSAARKPILTLVSFRHES